jgi:hypothetical protein
MRAASICISEQRRTFSLSADLKAQNRLDHQPIADRIDPLCQGPSVAEAQALKLVHMYPRLDAWLYSFVVSKGLVDCALEFKFLLMDSQSLLFRPTPVVFMVT